MTSDLEAAIPMKRTAQVNPLFLLLRKSRKLANSPRRYPGPAWFSGAKKHSVLLHLGGREADRVFSSSHPPHPSTPVPAAENVKLPSEQSPLPSPQFRCALPQAGARGAGRGKWCRMCRVWGLPHSARPLVVVMLGGRASPVRPQGSLFHARCHPRAPRTLCAPELGCAGQGWAGLGMGEAGSSRRLPNQGSRLVFAEICKLFPIHAF